MAGRLNRLNNVSAEEPGMSALMAAMDDMTVLSLRFTAKTNREGGCESDGGQHILCDRQHDLNPFSL